MSEGTEPEVIEAEVTQAETPVETVEAAKPETEETTQETAEGEQPEAETTETEDKPKRISGYDRMKRKNQYLQSEILRLQEQAGRPAPEPDKAPKEEDFNGDWGKYIAATAAFEAAKAVKGSLEADRKTANESKLAELQSEILSDFNERTEAFKSKATDFDKVVNGFVNGGGQFSAPVRELVMESDLGPQMTYHLAKNPALAIKLNGLSPLQAAKEFARIEDTLSKPSTKVTKAPAPIVPPKGGSNGNFDAASAEMSEYVAKRKAGWGS